MNGGGNRNNSFSRPTTSTMRRPSSVAPANNGGN